jgi:hypothetical protein
MILHRRRLIAFPSALILLFTFALPAGASDGFTTSSEPYITLSADAPAGSSLHPLISVGESVHDFSFEGLPDGVGLMPGAQPGTLDVLVAHEQTTVPFFGSADFQAASVSQLTVDVATGTILTAHVPIGPEQGYLRFCSAFMAGPAEGFRNYTFFTGEETNDIVDVAPGADYSADPSLDPQRQAGYQVALRPGTGEFQTLEGFGRLNHENTVAIPGYGQRKILLTTDDTFDGPSAQLYMYAASNENALWNDRGRLMAFQVTGSSFDGRVQPGDPFNGANDYLDLEVGEVMRGRFIPVPIDIAKGLTDEAPQTALENWSNENNVFQFIRLEDLAYDRNDPHRIYIADTGRSRVVPDDTTGRMVRGPSGTVGLADNGRIFVMELNDRNPRIVESLTVLADGDAPDTGAYVPFTSPDNVDTSHNSLMVQEDADEAQIWRMDLATGAWTSVATVNDPDGESSGITWAADWLGDGAWVLTVQAHGTNVAEEVVEIDGEEVTLKREDGQLLVMTLPGS